LVGEITTRSCCIAATSTAVLSHRKPAYAGTSRDSCGAQGSDKRNVLYKYKGHAVAQLVEELRTPEGPGFGSRWCHRIFHDNSSGCTMALGSTQPLTEMSTRNIYWAVKVAGALGWQPFHLHVLKSGGFNLLELSGPVVGLYRDCFTPYCINIQSLGLTRTASQLNRSTHCNKLHSVLPSLDRQSAINIISISCLYTHLSPGGFAIKLCTMHCSSSTRATRPFHPLLILITQSMITLCRGLIFLIFPIFL
jgi:hypothetical protein